MKKTDPQTAYVLAPLFFAVLVLMLALYILLPQKDFSPMENRSLQTRPVLTFNGLSDGSFMDRFETYTTEQLPFRDFFVNVKAALNRLMLSRENNGIIRGRDGYLFEKSYGILPQLGKNEAAILAFVKDAPRPVVIAIAPTASEMLKDYLPKGALRIDQKKELGDFYAKIEATGQGEAVDLIETLSAHSQMQLYYRTDHHWTTEGAYEAYVKIVSELDKANAGKDLIPPVRIDELTKHSVPDFYGTLYAKYKDASLAGDTLTYYDLSVESYERTDGSYTSLYDPAKLEIYDKYAFFLHGNDAISTIRSKNVHNGRHLIVFKDSYANCLIPFLTCQYEQITIVDLRYYDNSVGELLASDAQADILLLYNFSFLNEDNHFYRLTS